MTAPGFGVDPGWRDPLEVKGWDALDSIGAEEQSERQFQDELDHCTMYRQCFSSEPGRYVLTDLINTFFKQRIVQAEDPPGSLRPGIRQGQADVVIRIFRMIEFANTGGGKITGSGVVPEE